jgi:hypothetical protein
MITLPEIAQDIRNAIDGEEGKLREVVAQHLPVIERVFGDAEAAGRSELARAALAAVHLSPELGTAFANAIAIAEADVAKFAQGAQPPA